MDEVRRWSVTYTKHIKQKRKVYQDGFLAFHTGSRKTKLYDESKNVLEIRILKNDEVIKAGETLTFHSHIVDVGDCEGDDDKTSHTVEIENKVKIVAHSFGVRPAKKFRNPICADNSKIKVEKDESSAASPSASQKLIREFKTAELQKYVVTKSSPVTSDSSVTEWTALYSTQTMKKAKTYHDGYISLVSSGPRGRKVMLYDSRRNLLDSRFLNSDELVKSGESLSFGGHIVDIDEPEVNKPRDDNVVKVINSNCIKELKKSHRLQKSPKPKPTEAPHKDSSKVDLPNNTNSNISNSEWLVLYTTQLTQKAKKFHDGFLSFAHCGSERRKVMLYDTSRRLLDSRFLKRDENISSDEPLSFCGHLVHVGEPIGDPLPNIEVVTQRDETELSSETRNISGHQCFAKAYEILNVTSSSNAYRNEMRTKNRIPLKEASSRYCFVGHDKGSIVGSSCTDENISSNTIPTNKPLRDVIGILSSLQRPFGDEKYTPSGHTSSSVEHLQNHSHFQNQLEEKLVMDTKSKGVSAIKENIIKALNGEPGEVFSNQNRTSKSVVGDNSFVCTKLMDSPDKFGEIASQSPHEFYTRPERTTSMTGLQIFDSARNLGVIEERALKMASSPCNVASANGETHVAKLQADICSKENLTFLSSTEILTCYSSHILECNETENLKKDVGADNYSVVKKSVGDMDECPSFDLGF